LFLSRYNSSGGQINALENLNVEREDYEKRILELDEKKMELKKKLQKVKYEGVQNITRKQINEVEHHLLEGQSRLDRNRDNLERLVKKLVDSKAGIEHLYNKLIDIKLENEENIDLNDDNLVDCLKQIEKKCSKVREEIKDDEQYDEIIMRIQGLKVDKNSEVPLYKKLENDFPSLENVKNNVRVRIPDREKDDNFSERDPDAEAEAEANERIKIKVEAQMRYDRMEKNKIRDTKKSIKKF
jgi:uncharacterized coiled-coil protein SlyX